jgi:hypothetical protein
VRPAFRPGTVQVVAKSSPVNTLASPVRHPRGLVFAFCASVPNALGVEIIRHTNAPTSSGTDQAPTQCPAGKSLIGAGGKIANGNGQVDLGIFTNSSGPFPFGSAAFANVFGDFQQFKTQFNTTAASNAASLSRVAGGQ